MNVAERFKGYSMLSIVHLALGYKKPPLDRILHEVCMLLCQDVEDVKGPKRHRQLVICRQIFCYVARMATHETLLAIGQFIGGRDHSTTLHSISRVQKAIEVKDLVFMRAWKIYLSKSNLYNEKCDFIEPEMPLAIKVYNRPKSRSRKLTDIQIDNIMRLIKRGYCKQVVYRKYKISWKRLNNIIANYP